MPSDCLWMIRQGHWGHPQLDVNHLAQHKCLKKLILGRFTLWSISWLGEILGTYVNRIEVTRSYPEAVLLNEQRSVGVIHTWIQQTSQLISSISLPSIQNIISAQLTGGFTRILQCVLKVMDNKDAVTNPSVSNYNFVILRAMGPSCNMSDRQIVVIVYI